MAQAKQALTKAGKIPPAGRCRRTGLRRPRLVPVMMALTSDPLLLAPT
jgi:hypothetical protein